MRDKLRLHFTLFCGLAAFTLGCGAAPVAPPPPPEAVAVAPPENRHSTASSVEAEIGGLNEAAMERAFSSLAVQDCLQPASQKLGALGGELKLKLRINRDGGVRWAYFSESTLGDRDAELCLLALARSKTWPKPVGGEGLAEKSFGMDPRAEPASLEMKWLDVDLSRVRADASKCRHDVQGSFQATIYVRPDGRVIAAGVAPPDEKGELVADCVVGALRKARFRRAAPRTGKVSFQIP